jgi:protein ImuB
MALLVEPAPSAQRCEGGRAEPDAPWTSPTAPAPPDQQHALGWWALQFTPRVALVDEAVVLEVSASLRLFGGVDALTRRVRAEAAELGCNSFARASNALAAIALARAGVEDGLREPLHKVLDRVALCALRDVAEHQAVLSRLGCKTLGDVRRLPRGGLSRRFGKGLLAAMDQAYGAQATAHRWLELPEVFSARLELPGRVEVAEGLMFGARRLLTQMGGWLVARHAGVTSFTLRWKHDFHRPHDVPAWGQLTIRTAEPTREVGHFCRLLAERLAQTGLGACVEELVLVADDVVPLEEVSGTLLLDQARDGESVQQLTERLAARLGAHSVLRGIVRSDYRFEAAQEWVPIDEPAPRRPAPLPEMPLPTWLLNQPLRLAVRHERPLYQGPLVALAGPYRVEAGWWDHDDPGGEGLAARRDYYLMVGGQGCLLWVYRDLAFDEEARSPWYLHGIFG